MDIELIKECEAKAKVWLESPIYDAETKKEIQAMLDNENKDDLVDAFYQSLEFGTGGLRGIMGAGTNRMNKYIVGMARLPHHTYLDEDGVRRDQLGSDPIHGLTSEWQKVEMDVEYTEELDPEILANKGYSLAIGFACSWQGAYFKGSIGNKLYIDNVSVICE